MKSKRIRGDDDNDADDEGDREGTSKGDGNRERRKDENEDNIENIENRENREKGVGRDEYQSMQTGGDDDEDGPVRVIGRRRRAMAEVHDPVRVRRRKLREYYSVGQNIYLFSTFSYLLSTFFLPFLFLSSNTFMSVLSLSIFSPPFYSLACLTSATLRYTEAVI